MPLGGLVTAGVIGIGGAVLANSTGQGKTDFRASDYADTNKYDPNAQFLGSDRNQAGWLAGQYGDLANRADSRGFIQANNVDAQQARAMGLQSRDQQSQALALMRARATGQAPSIAQMQGDRALGQGLQNNMAMAASARGGPGAMALAARGAGMQNASMTGDIAGQSAIAAAQERQAAEQAYFGGASGMRQSDMGLQGMDQQFALGQGQLALGSQAQNDARAQAMRQMQLQTLQAQAQLRLQNQGMLSGTHMSADQQNGMINLANAKQQAANYQGMMGAASGFGQAAGTMGGGFGGGGGGGYAGSPGSGLPDPGY